MPNKDLLVLEIKKVLERELNIGTLDEVNEGTSLRDDLGLDSMSTLTFLMSLEDSIDDFTIDANTLEGHHVQTIGSLCGYVSERLAAVA